MNISERAVICAPLDEVWDFVTDVPRVGGCLPGTEEVRDLGDGAYGGAMRVKVGAISVRLEGKVRMVEQDEANHVAALAIEAADKRVKGAVTATTRMTLVPVDAATTELTLDTEAAVVGKLGQFGQAVIQKKTRQILDDFVGNMTLQLQGAASPEVAPTDGATVPAGAVGAGSTSGAHRPPAGQPLVAASGATRSGPVGGSTGGTALGLLVGAAGIVVGAVGAARSDPAWAILGLSLVTWGSFGIPRSRDGR